MTGYNTYRNFYLAIPIFFYETIKITHIQFYSLPQKWVDKPIDHKG